MFKFVYACALLRKKKLRYGQVRFWCMHFNVNLLEGGCMPVLVQIYAFMSNAEKETTELCLGKPLACLLQQKCVCGCVHVHVLFLSQGSVKLVQVPHLFLSRVGQLFLVHMCGRIYVW